MSEYGAKRDAKEQVAYHLGRFANCSCQLPFCKIRIKYICLNPHHPEIRTDPSFNPFTSENQQIVY